jgi:drug/metabolite transporter (DMT)-like permease
MPAYYGLIIAVFAVSWSSIFIRFCGDTPALVISFYRLFWSALIFTLYQLKVDPTTLKFTNLNKQNKSFILIAGIILAFHFITWIAAVQLTLVSHATILGSIHPVFALILSPFLLKEKGNWFAILAAILTMSGILLIGGQDLNLPGSKLSGDMFAIIAAFFVTIYIIIARHQRENINLIPYLIAVYSSAALTLFLFIVFLGYSFNYSIKTHFMMFLLALIPTCIGHSLINWGARKIEAYKVNFFIIGEPIFASLLAYLIWQEKPFGFFYLGSTLIFGGIILASYKNKTTK